MKNKFYLIICLLLLTYGGVMAQSVEINPASSSSAIISSTSTNKGLLVPRMTAAQREAISSPSRGLLVYQTDFAINKPEGLYIFTVGNYWATIEEPDLGKFVENGKSGYRLRDRSIAFYGNIGNDAMDLSISSIFGSSSGATGNNSFATGLNTTASGIYSTAMGVSSFASGQSSTSLGSFSRAVGNSSIAAGNEVLAKSFGELAVGTFNDTLTTVNSTTFAGDNNRIFTVGTGSSGTARRTSFVVQQNGNVGIGASSPNAQLQLGNTITNRKLVLYEVANNDHQYYGVGINNQVLRYQVDQTISSHAFFAGASATTSNELMRITGTGNVGIGTTAPSERLHVAGSVRIVDGTEGVGKVLTSDANGKGTWTTPAAGGNTSELQKITEGSNTGWRILGRDAANHGDIGANALDLSRSTLASTTTGATGSDAFAAGFITTASGTNSTAMGNSTSASGTFSTAMGSGSIASGQSSTAIGNFSRATGVVSIAAGHAVRAQSFGELAVGSFNDTLTTVNSSTFAGDNNRIFTVGTGSSGTARRTSFVVQQNGNVGIGASSPNAPLQFGNTIVDRKIVLFETANNNHQFFGLGIGNQLQKYQVGATTSAHAFFAGASATASNELMRITGTGNVGIGTTAPNAQLQLGNTITNRKIVLFEVANNDHQYYGLGINNQVFRYQVDNTISSHAFFAGASATTSNELMRITGTGNVGIGTNAPTERLDVVGSVRIVDGTQGAGKVLTSDANGRGTWTTPAASGTASELQKITEGSNTGWRILGRNADNYGNIGSGAFDLSLGSIASTTRGATGVGALAAGLGTTAFGSYSVAFGQITTASAFVSVAMGSYNTASGVASFAMGSYNTASGLASFAIGNDSRASGDFSTAMGVSTIATQYASTAMGAGSRATGVVSTAIGNQLIAKSSTEFVVGSFNDTLTTANSSAYVGDNNNRTFTVGTGSSNIARRTSFVIQQNGNVGIGSTAPSERLHVAGSVRIVDGTEGVGKVLTSDANGKATWTTPAAGGNTSELQKITEGSNTGWRLLGADPANYGNIGSNALDLSVSTTASTTRGATGTNAFATGINTTASGLYATAMGESTTATGAASTVMGFNTTASNQHSTAMGFSTTASGAASTAMGHSTTASGFHSTSMGIGTRATQYASTAMGAGSRATGVVSTAIGNELIAKSATEFVVGSFNDTLTTFDAISYLGDNNRTFTVGTGSSNTARRTSFVVQQNGNVGIGSSSPNAPLQFASADARRKIVLSEAFNNDNQFKGFGVFGGFLRYQVDKTSDVHAFFAGTSATTSDELMRITGTGNVGIGTAAPTQRLHVVGNIVYTGTSSAISDLRYKKNFSKIENPLNKVLALNGLHYDLRVDEFKENNFSKDRQIGFIAQEIEKIFPEMVLTDAKGYKSVNYSRLTPVLVEAIKELKMLNDELKGKNEKLEANSQKMEARLDKIEALLNR